VQLEVGGSNETVNVTTQEQIQTETARSRDDHVCADPELSLLGRSSLELLRILPGVVAPNASDSSLSVSAVAATTAAGTRQRSARRQHNVSIDGSRLIDIGSNSGPITPNNDFVQEVTVQVSNYAAEYGNSACRYRP